MAVPNDRNILVVGCGGLGCELLKLLSKTGYYNITVVDDDTVDITNLNRQFFFTLEDVGRSKAEAVAKKLKNSSVTAINSTIMKYKHLDFYRQFDVVYNCLDNNEARSFVNKRCVLAAVDMIDGGSAGWLGQAICIPNATRRLAECFDCIPRKANKFYPVCTIRQQPKNFEHCLIWAEQSEHKRVLSPETTKKIYESACNRADEFNIQKMSFIESETFLRGIIPSISTTNSQVASLMLLSRFNTTSYYLTQICPFFLEVKINSRNTKCISCSLPVYKCSFSKETVKEFLELFGATSLVTETQVWDKRSGRTEMLESLDGEYAVAVKLELQYGIYFVKESASDMGLKRIR